MTESPKFSGGVTPKVSLLANGVFAKVEALMNQIYAILQENHEALIRSVPGGRRFSEVAFFGSCLLDDGVDPVVKNIEVCTESQEFITVLNLVSTMSVEGRLRVARSIF